MRDIGNNDVPALTAAFDKAGIVKDRPAALSKFKEGHSVYADDSGVLYTHYEGHQQELSAALTAWSRTQEGAAFHDRRTLPKSEQNVGGVRSKSELVTTKDKADYIAKHGGQAYERLPTTFVAPSEVKYRDEYYKLSREQKSALVNQGVNASSFPPRPDPNQIAGGRVNREALAKDRATRAE